MKERPILFSGPMVRAIISGVKSQTRRVVKRPERYEGGLHNCLHCCPYGQPGDRLWVRETWRRACAHEDDDSLCIAYAASQIPGGGGLLVNSIPRPAGVERWESEDDRWRPSIFMPRWASRITLEVTGVRVERLQAISEADARAEGTVGGHGAIPGYAYAATPCEHYRHVWNQINGTGSWDANPWVWVVEFRRAEIAS